MMALLYPKSQKLQAYMSEYFCVVVRLCHSLLKFSKKSIVGQLLSPLGETEAKAFQSNLESWAGLMKDEVNFLLAQKIEEEAAESSTFRALSTKFSQSAAHRQLVKSQLQVLNFCSTYNNGHIWKQTRKLGTTALYDEFPQYRDWKNRNTSGTVVFTGKLGSGKSVLLANIVDDLYLHAGSDALVAYFFCRHDDSQSLKSRIIIGSLAHQLLRPYVKLGAWEKLIDDEPQLSDIEKILSILIGVLAPTKKVYIIVDGLDECSRRHRSIVLGAILRLQRCLSLLLCISIRLEPNNMADLENEILPGAWVLSLPTVNPEIEAYIDTELEDRIQSKTLIIGDPTLILEIRDALSKGSQGMFLWVALQLQALSQMGTDYAIRQSLADLPKDLSEMYSRILSKYDDGTEEMQNKIFQVVIAAKQPLTVEALREALSVVPGDAVWDPSKILNSVYPVLAYCGGLLTIDEEESTVRVVHHSVKQFLPQRTVDDYFHLADKAMAEIITTYLSYGIFETQVSTFVVPRMPTKSATSQIIRSLDSSTVQSLALKLLKHRKRVDFDVGKTITEAREKQTPELTEVWHFHPYAKSFWKEHVVSIGPDNTIGNLVIRLFESGSFEQDRKELVDSKAGGNDYLQYILEYGKTRSTRQRAPIRLPLMIDTSAVDTGPPSPPTPQF